MAFPHPATPQLPSRHPMAHQHPNPYHVLNLPKTKSHCSYLTILVQILIVLIVLTQLNVVFMFSNLATATSTQSVYELEESIFSHGRALFGGDASPEYFQQHMHDELRRLVTADTILSWTRTKDRFFEEINVTSLEPDIDFDRIHGWPKEEKKKAWADTSRHYIWETNICLAARGFRKAHSVKKHVLFTFLNENRGAFSMDIPNRTIEWDNLATHWTKWGCTNEEIWTYLDHPNTRAVFTTQHQNYAHPKVHSIPLGVFPLMKHSMLTKMRAPAVTRQQLLMINDNGWRHRANVTRTVMENFRGSNHTLNNTYAKGHYNDYLADLRQSKFILSPSGFGWDCYRIWDALYMGVVPIVEKYGRPVDGWRKSLDDLPVLWVNYFNQVTPELLEAEYPKIAAKADSYQYAKLTRTWWVNFIRSFVPEDITFFRTAKRIVKLPEPPVNVKLSTTYVAQTSTEALFRYYDEGPDRIPRILHFVYVSAGLVPSNNTNQTLQQAIPQKVLDNVQGWHRLHPDFAVMFWDNTAIRQGFPALVPVLEKITTMSWISNLVRYHALERYGGVYLDTDIVPLHALYPLLSSLQTTHLPANAFSVCEKPASTASLHSVEEYTKDAANCTLVNNAVIGVPRHHPTLQSIIPKALYNTQEELKTKDRYKLKTTGPPLWTSIIQQVGHMNILSPSLFYPCNWDKKLTCQADRWIDEPHVYGMHKWTMSWLRAAPKAG